MANWEKIGSVRRGKTGNNYIKIDNDVTLKAGRIVQIQDPRKRLDEMVAKGKMDADKAEEYKEKIPDYILKELVLPPEE
jgi:hypothetical protein